MLERRDIVKDKRHRQQQSRKGSRALGQKVVPLYGKVREDLTKGDA